MKIIIPVAGFARRLKPHTLNTPKALLTVAGKPIIAHIMDELMSWELDRLTIVYGRFGEQIKEYLGKRYKVKIDYRLQKQPLGPGHAVHLGIDDSDEDVLIIFGDTIFDADVKSVLKRGVSSIGVKEVEDVSKLGVVELKDGRVVRLVEKPAQPFSNLAIVGMYYIKDAQVLKRAIQETMHRDINLKGEFQLTDALQIMLGWGEVIESFPVKAWYDCGRLENLLVTNQLLLDRDGGFMGESEIVDSLIIPPVYIGKGCHIERSVVGPHVSLGKQSQVHSSVIHNSLIGVKSLINKALLSGSILGNRTEVSGKMQQINLGNSCWLKI